MNDFELQIKMFTDQLTDLIEQAKFQASQDFASERSNWEQTERSYIATISDMNNQIDRLKSERDEAKSSLYDLKDKLSGLM